MLLSAVALRRFDLDHPGAVVGEEDARERRGLAARAELENRDTFEYWLRHLCFTAP